MESTLENGNYAERDYFAKAKNILYTNGTWRLRIQEQNSEGKLDRIEYKVNQSPVTHYRNAIELPKLGMNLIEYRSIDKIGNSEQWKIQRIFKDTKAPQINWEFVGGQDKVDDQYFVNTEAQIQIQTIDIDSGVMGIYYKLNEGRWKSFPIDKQNQQAKLPLNEESIQNGKQNILEIAVIDQVLNRSEKIQIPYTVLNTIHNPTIQLDQVRSIDGVNYCNDRTTFMFLPSESRLRERVLYKSSQSTEWLEYVSGRIPFEESNQSNRELSIIYKNVNSIGLESQEETFSCMLDNNPPKSEILKRRRD